MINDQNDGKGLNSLRGEVAFNLGWEEAVKGFKFEIDELIVAGDAITIESVLKVFEKMDNK